MNAEPWKWTEKNLLEMISLGVQESVELDYKRSDALQRSDAKKNEISKDVSAFANSAGGTLVYGMEENGHVPTALDRGLDPDEISKEWLEQVINSRIQRRIGGVKVNQVQLVSSAPGRVAYVVYIPASEHAPHQAYDKRFYKRFNFESVPMEEYEVRDVANRASGPDLRLEFQFGHDGSTRTISRADADRFDAVQLTAHLTNSSRIPAEYAVIDIYVDSRIQLARLPVDVQKHPQAGHLEAGDTNLELTRLNLMWDRTKNMPIFQGVAAVIPASPLMAAFPRNISPLWLRFTLSSPGMSPRDEYAIIEVEGDRATIRSQAEILATTNGSELA